MSRNLRWKWIGITVVIAGCILGVTGLPTSTDELAANWKKNIRLGLDLKGGSHIALQIQVQDAFKAEAELVMDRLKALLRKQNIAYDAIERNDPNSMEAAGSIQVNIRGVPLNKGADFRRLVADATGQQWVVASEGSDYRLNLRKEAAIKLRDDTITQTISTLEKKVNGLGVAEASVQKRGGATGEAEVIVQLPGVDDPARVKSILQTSALLELAEVKGGPYSSREEALSRNNGILPMNSRLVRQPSGMRRGNHGGCSPVVRSSPGAISAMLRRSEIP